MGRDKYGDVRQTGLQNVLDNNVGENKTEVTEDIENKVFLVKFTESKRIYEVDRVGNVTYIGTMVKITPSPESNLTPQLVQTIDLTVRTYINIDEENFALKYAWSTGKEKEPSEYVVKETSEGTTKKTAEISSTTGEMGEYYLWVKVEIGESSTIECFGPYAIKDNTILRTANTEVNSDSAFLGNENIKRNTIESVRLLDSFTDNKGRTHSLNDENSWDLSSNENGRIIAWYEDEDNDGYYEVTIAQQGGMMDIMK